MSTAPPRSAAQGILSDDRREQREQIIEMLTKAYWMELETVMSYIANSTNPDGLRAQEIIESLQQDVTEELGHAQQFAARIKELYGVVPGSLDFKPEQSYLQPPEQQTDIVHVIKGVIEAETGAIEHYNAIIEATEGVDPVTNDMVIAILRDEEGHRRLFEGFLREFEAADGLAPSDRRSGLALSPSAGTSRRARHRPVERISRPGRPALPARGPDRSAPSAPREPRA